MNQDSDSDLGAAFAALRERLIDARKRYTKNNELTAAAAALHALNVFLQDRCNADELPAETLIPLNELISALADIEQGHKHPLLTPPKRKCGSRKNSTFYTQIMGTASASITFLMGKGYSEEEAAQTVALLMIKHGHPFPEGRAQEQWRKLVSMRDRLNQGGSKDPAVDIQDTCLKLFHQQTGIDPNQIIEPVFLGFSKNTT